MSRPGTPSAVTTMPTLAVKRPFMTCKDGWGGGEAGRRKRASLKRRAAGAHLHDRPRDDAGELARGAAPAHRRRPGASRRQGVPGAHRALAALSLELGGDLRSKPQPLRAGARAAAAAIARPRIGRDDGLGDAHAAQHRRAELGDRHGVVRLACGVEVCGAPGQVGGEALPVRVCGGGSGGGRPLLCLAGQHGGGAALA